MEDKRVDLLHYLELHLDKQIKFFMVGNIRSTFLLALAWINLDSELRDARSVVDVYSN